MGTKKNIEEYVILHTKQLILDIRKANLHACTTAEIGSQLHLSRNLVSQYLNELVKEKVLIKISSRPVYFLHKESVGRKLNLNISELESLNGAEFLELLKKEGKSSIFGQMIGYNTSLAYCIEQCEAAIKYPRSGLPILLVGESGTGKNFLAKLLYQYGEEEGVFGSDSRFAVLECGEVEKTLEGGMKEIFGYNISKNGKRVFVPGLLNTTREGVLFLNNVSLLGSKCQEKLAEFLENRNYSSVNNETEKYDSHAHIIFSVTPELKNQISKELLAQIPVLCKVSPLRERRPEDKEKLIVKFFRDEEIAFQRDIYISRLVFHSLLDYEFEENISQLKNCIKVTCANAFFNQENEAKIRILPYHLPEYLLVRSNLELWEKDTEFIEIKTYGHSETVDKILLYYEKILSEYKKWKSGFYDCKEFVNQSTTYMNQYYDYLIYDRKYDNRKIKVLEQIVQKILTLTGNQYGIFLPTQCGYILTRGIYMLMGIDSDVVKWEELHKEEIEDCLQVLESEYSVEMHIAMEIQRLLKGALGIPQNKMSIVFLLLNIRFFNRNIRQNHTMSIIMTVGYMTAGAIADTVNRLLGKHLYDSIDIPLEYKKEELLDILGERFDKEYLCKRICLLTDLSNGEKLAEELACRYQIEVVYLNQISTELAVQMGEIILQDREIKSSLKQLSETNAIKGMLFSQGKKPPAILFASESGEIVNQRIIRMFEESILRKKQFQFIPYSVDMLSESGWQEIKNHYDVLFLLGTQNPGIEDVSFIALENIISFQDLGEMNKILRRYLTEEDVEQFNEELVKNFTLQNVVSQLTILDAATLMDYLEQALKYLQAELGYHLKASTNIGISIHLACMVERLVTKSEIEKNARSEQFEKEHPGFIKGVEKSFYELMKHYHIRIPVSEILYIYDYIKNENQEITEDF